MDDETHQKKKINWGRWSRHMFVVLSLTGAITYYANDYLHFKSFVLSNYSEISYDIETLIYNDETAGILCQKYSPTPYDNYSCDGSVCKALYHYSKYNHKLKAYEIAIVMANKYADLNKRLRALGGFFKHSTYIQVRQFTCWQNQFWESKGGLCKSTVFLSNSELDQWKDGLMIQINKDQRKYDGFFYSVWEYFIYYLPTDRMETRYPIVTCNLCDTPFQRLCAQKRN